MTESAANPGQKVSCGACYVTYPIREMASLTDKHDHGWYICPECITALWQAKRPPLTPPEPASDPDALTALAVLVGSMGVIHAMLVATDYGIPPGILTGMASEINTARKVYSDDT